MSWMNEIGDLLKQYRGSGAQGGAVDPQADFARVAQSAPSSALSGGLAQAFRSSETPAFGQLVSQLFSQSDPNQRAGILNHLIQAAGPSAGGLLGGLMGQTSGGAPSVTAAQAQQVNPDVVQQIAAQAEQRNPSIVDQASSFYAQHPKLIQGLGAGVLAVVMSHLSHQAH